jgi:PAS domain S-box-containing protein
MNQPLKPYEFSSKTQDNQIFCQQLTQLEQKLEVCQSERNQYIEKKAELQRQEQQFYVVFQHLSHFVCLLEPDGRITEINQVALNSTGLTAEVAIGRPFWLLPCWTIALDTRVKLRAAIARAAAGETICHEIQALSPGASETWLDFSFRPIHDERGQIAFLLVEGQGVTQRKQAEQSSQERAKELSYLNALLTRTTALVEKRNQELDQFAYIASHDLKAPLRAIANLSEWIEEDLQEQFQLPEENKHQLLLLRGRVQRMEALINGLLEYSRIGRTQATAETVSVQALLDEVLDLLDPPASFVIAIEPNLPTLTTKQILLKQVFANLINNAIKHHNRSEGKIIISVQDREKWYEFAVADDGPGIAAEYHDKIFAIFQTLEARDTKESTGVGLSIVKKIVETEGGTVRLESQLNAGATFYFTWPKQVVC